MNEETFEVTEMTNEEMDEMSAEPRNDSDVEIDGVPVETREAFAEMQAKIEEMAARIDGQAEAPGPEPSPAEMANGLIFAAYERLVLLIDQTEHPEVKRALALAVTKAEEALLWLGRAQQLQQFVASEEGKAIAGDSGLTVVEKPELVVVGDPGRPEPAASETAGDPA